MSRLWIICFNYFIINIPIRNIFIFISAQTTLFDVSDTEYGIFGGSQQLVDLGLLDGSGVGRSSMGFGADTYGGRTRLGNNLTVFGLLGSSAQPVACRI